MKNPASENILTYWSALTDGDGVPLKSDIDPVALRRFLPHLFIAAQTGRAGLSFRLAGTQVCDLYGCELRGYDFREIWLAEDDMHRAEDLALSVIEAERPASVTAALVTSEQILAYELLLLPLRPHKDARSDRLLGALLPQRAGSVFHPPAAQGLLFEDWTFLDDDPFSHRGDSNTDGIGPGLAARLLRLIPRPSLHPQK